MDEFFKKRDEFLKERNEVFASLDEKRIRDYCKKYNIAIPEDDTVFWKGVHKAVCSLFLSSNDVITVEQYKRSVKWLIDHGSTPTF